MRSRLAILSTYFTAAALVGVAGFFAVLTLIGAMGRPVGLLVAGILLLAALGVAGYGMVLAAGRRRMLRVREHGVPGQARVVGIKPTGLSVNYNPQLRLRLRIVTQVHGTYETSVKEFLDPAAASRLASAPAAIEVRVDPQDRDNVYVDWTAAITAAGMHFPPGAQLF